MSWSRSYGPLLLAAVLEQARADAPEVKKTIPEFEHAQVDAAIDAAETIGKTLREDAQITLSLSGHGWINEAEGNGSGNVSSSLGYSLPALPKAAPVDQGDGAGGAASGSGE